MAEKVIQMFEYFNPNPEKDNAGDCVIRAICKATGKDWNIVYIELCIEGFIAKDWGSNNTVWDGYLRRNGYKRYIIPNTCPDCYTIADFAADNPKGVYIVATGSHVGTVVDGVIYDSWDSRGKVPLYYFHKEQENL